MLNELKVNHMGGADNYGVDDFYNIDDPWNDTKQPIKPKVGHMTSAAPCIHIYNTALFSASPTQCTVATVPTSTTVGDPPGIRTPAGITSMTSSQPIPRKETH